MGLKAIFVLLLSAVVSAQVTGPSAPQVSHVIVDSGTVTATVSSADISDRAGRLVGVVSFGSAQPVTFSNSTIAVTNVGTFAVQIGGTLPAFTAIPAFKIDQTTPGTTNAVAVTNAFALEATQLLQATAANQSTEIVNQSTEIASLATLAATTVNLNSSTRPTTAILVQPITPGPPLPRFPCNAVRQTNCQPKGY